jgi:hypothetical protein
MSSRVFYNANSVIHSIKYNFVKGGYYKVSDPRTRWAYVVLNETEVKEHLGENNNQDLEAQLDIIKAIYLPYLLDGITQEDEKDYTIYSFKDNHYEVDNKLVFCTSALNMYPQEGYYSMLKTSRFNEEAQKLGRPSTKKQENVSKLYFNKQISQDKLSKEYKHYKLTSNKKEYLEHSMVVAIPYVYNYEDNKDKTSKLKSMVKEDEATASAISKYDIDGYWVDENKQKIEALDAKYNLQFKNSKDAYYMVKTRGIEDGTIAYLTIYDEDMYAVDDSVGNIPFTINNNEAFIHVDLNTIKFNILKAFRDEEFIRKAIDEIIDEPTMKIRLIGEVRIKSLKLKEKFKESKRVIEPEYTKIGTRALQTVESFISANSFPSEIVPITLKVFGWPVGVILKAGEWVLDSIDTEPIHEQISFINKLNLGVTGLDIALQNTIDPTDAYGQIKTDEEMTSKDTIEALDSYDWNLFYCDEDTFKEAIYQTINDYEYSSSSSIHQMNLNDIDRLSKTLRETDIQSEITQFTRINSLTPKEARIYRLFTDNCQSFISRVFKKYEELENQFRSNEELGVYEKERM